jgi:hypothetical protein
MALTGFIRRLDGTPLGTDEEVMRQLSAFFPGVSFAYEAERSPGVLEAHKRLSPLLRLWLYFFTQEVPYPRHYGHVKSPSGWAIEFYFVARPTVLWVQTTAYGKTQPLDEIFKRLQQATDWVTSYPR